MGPTEAEKHTYRVLWSEEDQEFVGLCAEFPSLSWLAPTKAEALRGIAALVGDVLEDKQKIREGIQAADNGDFATEEDVGMIFGRYKS